MNNVGLEIISNTQQVTLIAKPVKAKERGVSCCTIHSSFPTTLCSSLSTTFGSSLLTTLGPSLASLAPLAVPRSRWWEEPRVDLMASVMLTSSLQQTGRHGWTIRPEGCVILSSRNVVPAEAQPALVEMAEPGAPAPPPRHLPGLHALHPAL